MTIEIFRSKYTETYTEGDMYIRRKDDGGLSWFAATLEPAWRDLSNPAHKVPGKTCIPAGRYNAEYSFSWHFRRKLPRLLAVPHFEGILIHSGNTAEKDSKGCILVGIKAADGRLANSRFTLERLCTTILNEGADRHFTIIIHDGYECPKNSKD